MTSPRLFKVQYGRDYSQRCSFEILFVPSLEMLNRCRELKKIPIEYGPQKEGERTDRPVITTNLWVPAMSVCFQVLSNGRSYAGHVLWRYNLLNWLFRARLIHLVQTALNDLCALDSQQTLGLGPGKKFTLWLDSIHFVLAWLAARSLIIIALCVKEGNSLQSTRVQQYVFNSPGSCFQGSESRSLGLMYFIRHLGRSQSAQCFCCTLPLSLLNWEFYNNRYCHCCKSL